jgi:hypothetical protein
MYSSRRDLTFIRTGFPIRKSPDQSLLSGSPRLIAASHVLHRHLLPRHPPYALSSLTKFEIFWLVLLNADAVLYVACSLLTIQFSKSVSLGPAKPDPRLN